MRKFIFGLVIGIISGILIWDYLKLDLHLEINPVIGDATKWEQTGEIIEYKYRGFNFTIFKLKDYDGISIFNIGIVAEIK